MKMKKYRLSQRLLASRGRIGNSPLLWTNNVQIIYPKDYLQAEVKLAINISNFVYSLEPYR